MKEIVVRLSAARPIAFSWSGLVGHALLVGLPIALVAQRFATATAEAAPGAERQDEGRAAQGGGA